MQVACDHCGAEYELDESEITGRGVRITCPSCSHVFVVYQTKKEGTFEMDVELELADNGELSMDLDDMLGDVMAEMIGDAPEETPVTEPVETETSTPSNSNATENIQMSSSLEKEDDDEDEVISQVEPNGKKQITSEHVAALDVHSLNFASVGIKSWKVKKPIGLMFEYSDYKTFQKSLNDGRISSGDQISPDGSIWTPMSDIEDFETFFCKTYLEFEQNEHVEEVKQVKEKVISAVGGTNELASALAAAQAEVELANRPKSSRKPASQRAKRKPQAKKSVEPPKSSSSLLLNIGIGLVVIVAGYLVLGGDDTSAPVPVPQAQTTNTKPAVGDASNEEDESLKRLREELQRNAAKLEEQQEPDPEPSSEEEPQLIAKVPDEILAQQRALKDGQNPLPTQKKVNHVQEGQKALNAQQWSSAISSFNQAYQSEPNPEYLSSVGFAQFKSGQLGLAKKTLLSAASKGSLSANKWLGYIMREEGDIAGSNQYFNQYLQSNPPDAGQIRQEMMQ